MPLDATHLNTMDEQGKRWQTICQVISHRWLDRSTWTIANWIGFDQYDADIAEQMCC